MSDIYDTIIIALRVEMSTIYDIIFQRNKKTIPRSFLVISIIAFDRALF